MNLTYELDPGMVKLNQKGKSFQYSLLSIGPKADPGVQAVIHPAVGCHYFLPVTFPATEHHRPLAGTMLYCLMRGTQM